jgi:hypothetical protein
MKTRTNPRNPTAKSIIPTPEEAQLFVAEKERKAREAERARQIRIEADLKAALLRRCKVNEYREQRAKRSLPVFGPLTRQATREEAWRKEFEEKIRQKAWAIAHARGSEFAMLCDFREARQGESAAARKRLDGLVLFPGSY